MTQFTGSLKKMQSQLSADTNAVEYSLPVGDQLLALNAHIGSPISLSFTGSIACTHCGRATKKSFNQGHCYPCFKRLAQCDSCMVSPEKCHYEAGTCRDPEWADTFCMMTHIVYLSNASGPKVGITRQTQVPTRWIDQGASQALPIIAVQTRQQSGLVEVLFKNHIADKTNWRAMLKGTPEPVDLKQLAAELLQAVEPELTALQDRFGLQAIQVLEGQEQTDISFPVDTWPVKVTSINAEKTPDVSGVLQGIKGQYLILDTGVINMRKYTGYEVAVTL